MTDIQAYRLSQLPEAGYYIPNFISVEQEKLILEDIAKLPEGRWKVLTHRRLLSLPSHLTGSANDTLIDAALPRFLTTPILTLFKQFDLFADSPHHAPNHCLVNEYRPGQGIMPHEDGPAYYPLTATVTLGSHTVLDIYKKTVEGEREASPTWRMLQEPGSLLITTKTMYTDTIHGIAEIEEDRDLTPENIVNWNLLGDQRRFESGIAERELRISLTYRDVLKVAKLGGAIKFMNKQLR